MSDLGDAVQVRYGAGYLKGITNEDATATTVDTTVLEAAASDVTGIFNLETGITFDAANSSHLAIAIPGVIAQLEKYKSRDSNIANQGWKNFLGSLLGLRKKTTALPTTNSMYNPYREAQQVRPDMDRDNVAFRGRNPLKLNEISGE
jgi:hypothetical protein